MCDRFVIAIKGRICAGRTLYVSAALRADTTDQKQGAEPIFG